MGSTLSLPELYAISQSHSCLGTEHCHWCNSPCGRVWLHDDPPLQIGVKRDRLALNYPSPYVCVGCWLWRRASITAFWLTSGYKDRQKPYDHSWLITEEGAWAVRREYDGDELYANLLDPPRKFALALIDGDKMQNHPQLGVVNELSEIKAETPLKYTLNGIVMTYTVYELEEMKKDAKNGGQGKSPGVQALVRLFGRPKAEKKGRGRPRKEEINVPQKVIRQSA